MIKFFLVILIFLSALNLSGCRQKKFAPQQIVLKIDEHVITLTSFRRYYELDPSFPGYVKGQRGLQEYAEQLADHFLAERRAVQENVFNKPFMRRQLNYKKQTALIQALFKKKISEQIKINEAELRSAYKKMAVRIRVKQIFTPSLQKAQYYYKQLEQGISFDSLAKIARQKDSDLGEITWGDLDLTLEKIAFQLPVHSFSKPIHSRWGYHILKVTDRKTNVMLTKSEFQLKRKKIYQKVKRRKEALLANDYVKKLMTPLNVTVKVNAFRRIIDVLGLEEGMRRRISLQRLSVFSDSLLKALTFALHSNLKQPFMTSKKENWTIGDFLNILSKMPPVRRPSIASAVIFKKDLGLLIRNYFLLKMAKKIDLQKTQFVDSTLTRFRCDLAYNYYLQRYFSEFTLPQNVRKYYRVKRQRKKIAMPVPKEILPGMRREEDYRFYYAARKLHARLIQQFPDAKIEINHEIIEKEAKRINWRQPLRMFVVENSYF